MVENLHGERSDECPPAEDLLGFIRRGVQFGQALVELLLLVRLPR